MIKTWKVKHFKDLSNWELYNIFHIRLAVFCVEQNCPYQDADGKDQDAFHLTGYDERGKLGAYARIVQPGVSYKEVSIGRIVTSKVERGTGAGKELMQKSFDFIKEQYGKVPIRISAQSYLKRFYLGFGFEVIGEEYIEDHIPHMEMLREYTQPLKK